MYSYLCKLSRELLSICLNKDRLSKLAKARASGGLEECLLLLASSSSPETSGAGYLTVVEPVFGNIMG